MGLIFEPTGAMHKECSVIAAIKRKPNRYVHTAIASR
ncbi:MAG: hypothetical protein ACI91J_001940, partial [Yoonia sp.]